MANSHPQNIFKIRARPLYANRILVHSFELRGAHALFVSFTVWLFRFTFLLITVPYAVVQYKRHWRLLPLFFKCDIVIGGSESYLSAVNMNTHAMRNAHTRGMAYDMEELRLNKYDELLGMYRVPMKAQRKNAQRHRQLLVTVY
jgi:hypothetical protein